MALLWTGSQHDTRDLAELDRDYPLLAKSGEVAHQAVLGRSLDLLCEAVQITHEVQLLEGMKPLPSFGEKAKKYCGSGHGGYAVYLFDERPELDQLIPIEPYMEQFAGY